GRPGRLGATRVYGAFKHGSLGAGCRRLVSTLDQVLVPLEPQQRCAPRADPELPRHVVGRRPPRPHAPLVNPPQVVPGADGDAVVARVAAAARAEEEVMVVQVPPRRAGRHGAAPAIAREDRVAVTRLLLPFGPRVLEEPLEAAPRRLEGLGKGRDRLAQQHLERGGGEEDDLRVEGRAFLVRTHLALRADEGRPRRGRLGPRPGRARG